MTLRKFTKFSSFPEFLRKVVGECNVLDIPVVNDVIALASSCFSQYDCLLVIMKFLKQCPFLLISDQKFQVPVQDIESPLMSIWQSESLWGQHQ